MDIQIIESSTKVYPNLGHYLFVEMRTGKHHATFSIASDHIRVIVHNSSNRAWRGLGKRFADSAAALDWYKTPEIRAMLQEAVAMKAASLAQVAA